MLKKIRLGISIAIFLFISLYFLDFAELLPAQFQFIAKIQFVPALLAVNLAILAALIIGTFIFGRIYCSIVCPMGILQDVIGRIALFFSRKKGKKKKRRYKYAKPQTILRWSILGIAALALVSGFTLLAGLLDPYSAFGRITVNIFRPFYMAGNNVLASLFMKFGNYTFYKVEIFVLSISALIIAIVTLLIVGWLAWKHGRTYCNTVCPVGTLLGFVSRFSIFKIRMIPDKCNACGLCEMNCKSLCINSKERKIDYSRCVTCYNCIESCNRKAMIYSAKEPKSKEIREAEETGNIDARKRQFLSSLLTTAAVLPFSIAKEKTLELATGKLVKRKTPITPPGSISIGHFGQHCTSCHLCISKCPSKVLKPAFLEYGLSGMLQPVMFFEKGFCNFDCTVCSEVCPNGAIKPLTKEEKHITQVGRVVFVEELCVVITDGTNCGACSEHCPTQAVAMVSYKGGLTLPSINPDICVGCGGCESICPVRPLRAIFIEGNAVHQQAEPIQIQEKKEIQIDDFGF